ncbi:hypothetical protein G5V57_01545 [Nordella sp. HKS 07]|uniref:hypothetical protein n=1 Tax=Nordella sp. HKS 07 TaxID=2712222 RepID=UPI0013E158E4|nr:hypothetical protein [Nordella sp. HKS 07]QIG46558.1 hypothetical protein G5V57_01545 [Nordella sp. HKS 07]
MGLKRTAPGHEYLRGEYSGKDLFGDACPPQSKDRRHIPDPDISKHHDPAHNCKRKMPEITSREETGRPVFAAEFGRYRGIADIAGIVAGATTAANDPHRTKKTRNQAIGKCCRASLLVRARTPWSSEDRLEVAKTAF